MAASLIFSMICRVLGPFADLSYAIFHHGNRLSGLVLDIPYPDADFLGRICGSFRQRAHLVGHYCETAPLLAGTGSYDRGAKRQKVGLIGDILDSRNDLPDLLGAHPKRGNGRKSGIGGDPLHAGDG